MSWLQRGAVWAWLCCYSIPLKLLLGVVVSGGRVRTISPEVCHSFLHLGWAAGISLADPILLLLPLFLLPSYSSKMWLQDVVLKSCEHGSGDVALKKCQSHAELSPVEWSKAAVELSLNQAWCSGAAVQHNTDDLVSRVLSGIVFHFLSLFSIVSGLGMGRASCGECPRSCLSPSSHMELSQSGKYLLCG